MALLITQLAQDTFFRADENPLANPPWVKFSNLSTRGLRVVSDACQHAAYVGGGYYAELYSGGPATPNDQYCTTTIASVITGDGQQLVLGARITDNGSSSVFNAPGYVLTGGPSGGGLYSYILYVGGVNTASGNVSGGSGVGDVFVLAVVGTTVIGAFNGTAFLNVTDTTYSSGVTILGMGEGLSTIDITYSNFAMGSASIGATVSGSVGVIAAGATISWSGSSSGSTTANGSGNYTTTLPNGNYIFQASLAGFSFAPVSAAITVAGSNIVQNFTATAIPYYSVPDCRNFGIFPNASRNLNNTLIYDVQTSDNVAVPGTDSRGSKPVDSSSQPSNSRTPGKYGPGE